MRSAFLLINNLRRSAKMSVIPAPAIGLVCPALISLAYASVIHYLFHIFLRFWLLPLDIYNFTSISFITLIIIESRRKMRFESIGAFSNAAIIGGTQWKTELYERGNCFGEAKKERFLERLRNNSDEIICFFLHLALIELPKNIKIHMRISKIMYAFWSFSFLSLSSFFFRRVYTKIGSRRFLLLLFRLHDLII